MAEDNPFKELKDMKEEDETSKSQAPSDDKKADDKAEGDKKPEDKSSDDEGVDYKAELERVKAERDNYKKGLLDEKDKNSKRKGNSQNDDDVDDNDDDTVPTDKIADIVRRENEKQRADLIRDVVDESVSNLSENDAERDLILYHYNNTIVKSGSSRRDIQRDLERAQLLANAPKVKVTLEEARRKVESEKTKNKRGSASGQKADDTTDYSELSEADKALMKRAGITAADVAKTQSRTS